MTLVDPLTVYDPDTDSEPWPVTRCPECDFIIAGRHTVVHVAHEYHAVDEPLRSRWRWLPLLPRMALAWLVGRLITRCAYCRHIIWPWSRIGWRTGVGHWHPACYERETR